MTLHIAYVVVMFPCYSETFVLREIREVASRGARVSIVSLRAFTEKIMDDEARPLLPRTLYSPYLFSLALLRSHLHFLFRRPLAYFGIFRLFLRRLILHPRELIKHAVLFPKAVHFARLLRERGVDHVHAHFTNYPGSAAYIISRLTGIPFTMTAHAHDIFQTQLLLADKIAAASRLFAISDYNRRFIIERCGDRFSGRIEVLHCGLDLSRIHPNPSLGASSPPLILSVGRMVGIKGFDMLIEALAALRDRGRSFRCVIVGEGPERGRLERRIRELDLEGAVRLVGERRPQEVLEIMAEARVFALASRKSDRKSGVMDGIPVSIMEAMAAGVPVVSSPVSGIPELVEDGVTGLLARPGDASDLAGAIDRLLADRRLARRLVEAARNRVEREFNIARNVARLMEVFARGQKEAG